MSIGPSLSFTVAWWTSAWSGWPTFPGTGGWLGGEERATPSILWKEKEATTDKEKKLPWIAKIYTVFIISVIPRTGRNENTVPQPDPPVAGAISLCLG